MGALQHKDFSKGRKASASTSLEAAYGGDTRRASHEAAKQTANGLRKAVMGALSDAALTADEIASKLGLSVLSIRPRVTELAKAGKIIATPLRRKNASGKSAKVWMIPA